MTGCRIQFDVDLLSRIQAQMVFAVSTDGDAQGTPKRRFFAYLKLGTQYQAMLLQIAK